MEPTILELIEEHATTRRKADESWDQAKAHLPERPGRLLLKDAAYGAVLGAGMPLTLDQAKTDARVGAQGEGLYALPSDRAAPRQTGGA